MQHFLILSTTVIVAVVFATLFCVWAAVSICEWIADNREIARDRR